MLTLLFGSDKPPEAKKLILQEQYGINTGGALGEEVIKVSELEQAIERRGVRRGAQEHARETARRMIMGHLPLSQIVAFSLLDQDTVEELADEMGVTLPPDPDTP